MQQLLSFQLSIIIALYSITIELNRTMTNLFYKETVVYTAG